MSKKTEDRCSHHCIDMYGRFSTLKLYIFVHDWMVQSHPAGKFVLINQPQCTIEVFQTDRVETFQLEVGYGERRSNENNHENEAPILVSWRK